MATAAPQLPPAEFIRIAKSIEDEVGKVIVGQDAVGGQASMTLTPVPVTWVDPRATVNE